MNSEENIGLGNELNRILLGGKNLMYNQGELAQLTHSAFDHAANLIQSGDDQEITVDVPIGYRPDKTPITSPRTYKKHELIGRYQFLAFTQIPINGIFQLVMIVEATLGDLIRQVVFRYPNKLSAKRQLPLKKVLEAQSIEEVRLTAVNILIHELGYKSPKEFADEVEQILSVNLLECPSYHRYIEMKATRDILLHNQGIANEVYVAKAGSHARVVAGGRIPISQPYLLEVYEECLQLIEWLERKLHEKWHSSEHESAQADLAARRASGSDNP